MPLCLFHSSPLVRVGEEKVSKDRDTVLAEIHAYCQTVVDLKYGTITELILFSPTLPVVYYCV